MNSCLSTFGKNRSTKLRTEYIRNNNDEILGPIAQDRVLSLDFFQNSYASPTSYSIGWNFVCNIRSLKYHIEIIFESIA